MRTTLTLDDDVANKLKEVARRSGGTFKEVVNSTLRKGLRAEGKPSSRPSKFEVKAKSCGFQEGVDVLRLNQLHDAMEMEDFQRKLASDRVRR